MLLAGLRQRHVPADAESGIALQWRQFRSSGELRGRSGAAFYGVMCGHDAAGFEYMCGVEVASFAGLPDGTGRMRVPAQHYAVFNHAGPASTLRSTWRRILDWLAGGGHASAHGPDFELYRPGAGTLAGGGIEVWVGVVPRAAGDA